jgi:hypothetical protein
MADGDGSRGRNKVQSLLGSRQSSKLKIIVQITSKDPVITIEWKAGRGLTFGRASLIRSCHHQPAD